MANYAVLGDISETLRKLLEDDPWTDISPKPDISLGSPKEIKDEPGVSPNKVSVFLYQIAENAHMKNQEMQRIDDKRVHFPPMYLDLSYLITTYSNDPVQEKYILGKVIQIFFDNAILSGTVLQKELSGSDEELKLLFNPLTVDEMTKIWGTFQEVSYKLSVSYIVTPVSIDSTREMGIQRVVSRDTEHHPMVP